MLQPLRRHLTGCVGLGLAVAGLTGCGGGPSAPGTVTVTAPAVTVTAGAQPAARPTSSQASSSATSPTGTATSSGPSVDGVTRDSFDRMAGDYLKDRKGAFGVVATDLQSGQTVQHNAGQRCETASMVKLDVLLTLLLQRQEAGEELSASDRALTSSMIIYSDNNATTQLWRRVGLDDGVREANERFGMTETEPGTQYRWGLTTTTAADQVRLLRNLVRDEPLTKESRDYAIDLMSRVSAGQDWGVSAANPQHEAPLKNGWLPRSEGWVVTSAGKVTAANGHELLMSVVSCRGGSQGGSVETIEHLARMAAKALES